MAAPHPIAGFGRITRALTDLALAQADAQSIRLYAMSAAILASRSDYYRILEKLLGGGRSTRYRITDILINR